MSEGMLVWGLLLGSVGLGYAVYGRKQRAIAPFIAGLSLMGLPYFVPNTLWLVIGAIGLLAIPLVIRA